MQPIFSPGDAILTRPLSFNQLHIGQIVSFEDATSDRLITTHRVIAIDRSHATFTTKGDNTATVDLPHQAPQLLGQAVFVAPHFGRWLNRVRSPLGLVICLYMPCAVLLAHELRRFSAPRAIYYGR